MLLIIYYNERMILRSVFIFSLYIYNILYVFLRILSFVRIRGINLIFCGCGGYNPKFTLLYYI